MDLSPVIESLCQKRPIFHSEADFQFALAWEIQRLYSSAEVRLEYSPVGEPNSYIDILVRDDGFAYPIELKYKTRELSTVTYGEQYNLKSQDAQDCGKYDFVKDICRIESFATHLNGFKYGYALWLTNDPHYWNEPSGPDVGYVAFSVHQGAMKTGTMKWGSSVNAGTTGTREKEILLRNEYEIDWKEYSNLGIKNGVFKYALLRVE